MSFEYTCFKMVLSSCFYCCFQENIDNMGDDEVHSKTLGMRIQGKIASKMSSKGLAKQVVDGPTSDLIDNCYKIAKHYLQNKKDAEKIMKNLIKIVIKVALLSRNNQFTSEDLKYVDQFETKFKSIAKAVISFHNLDFTFDVEYMKDSFKESQELLILFTKDHLTEKSMKRIDHVYNFYSDPELLEQAFQPGTKYRPYLTNIVTALDTLLERGEL